MTATVGMAGAECVVLGGGCCCGVGGLERDSGGESCCCNWSWMRSWVEKLLGSEVGLAPPAAAAAAAAIMALKFSWVVGTPAMVKLRTFQP